MCNRVEGLPALELVKCTVIAGRTLIGPADHYNSYDRTIKFFQVWLNYKIINILVKII